MDDNFFENAIMLFRTYCETAEDIEGDDIVRVFRGLPTDDELRQRAMELESLNLNE